MTTECEIDLLAFCYQGNDADSRVAITAPFIVGGWEIATDGCILVALPTTEPDTPPRADGKRFPRVSELLQWNGSLAVEPWPTTYVQCHGKCRKCNGTGAKRVHACTECEGEGVIECHICFHEEECAACDGSGEVRHGKCPVCNGSRELVRDDHVRIGQLAVDWKYAEKIKMLPGVRCFSDGERVLFTFDGGGRGVVMPVILPEDSTQ